jgi:hypothetical protein
LPVRSLVGTNASHGPCFHEWDDDQIKKNAEVPAGLGGSSGDEGMPLIALKYRRQAARDLDAAQARCNNLQIWGAVPPNRQPEHSCAHG